MADEIQKKQKKQKGQNPIQCGIIYSINISSKKGGRKFPVEQAVIDELGLIGDGHRGNWNRQVSILSYEKIENFKNILIQSNKVIAKEDLTENLTKEEKNSLKENKLKKNVSKASFITAGDFGENITTLNFNLESLKVGDRLKIFDDCNSINDENSGNLSENTENIIKSIIKSDSHNDNCIVLEVSQIGKNCPKPCSIYYRIGSCIMPNFGIFCKVVKGGIIKKGFKISLI